MNEEIRRIWRRLQLFVALGRVSTGRDTGAVQELQLQIGAKEIQDNAPRLGEWGFASMPLPGCHAVMVFVGGDRSNGVIVGTNDQQHRMRDLKPGEVAIHDDQGQSVYITRDGIVIDGGGKAINFVNTPSIKHDGVEIGNPHRHGGVQSGGSTTSTPV